jgi:hypothetical protein
VVSGALHSHMPDSQLRSPPQAFSQVPQFSRSVCTSTQPPAQFSVPAGQLPRHWPPEHTCAPLHVLPHAPQLAWLESRTTQSEPHSTSPASQVGAVLLGRHRPSWQVKPSGQEGSASSPQ